jgi:hypothetical protein
MLLDKRFDWKLLVATVPVGMVGTWVLDAGRLVFMRFGLMEDLPPFLGRRVINLISGKTRMGAVVEEEPPQKLETVAGYEIHYVNGVVLAALYALAVPRKRLGATSGVVYGITFPELAMMLAMMPSMGHGVADRKMQHSRKTLLATGLNHVFWGAALGKMMKSAAEITRKL